MRMADVPDDLAADTVAPGASGTGTGFGDADLQRTILGAIRLLGVLTSVAMVLTWWKFGWQTALLVVLGAAISGSGLWEWMRLMTAVMERMEVGSTPRPMGALMAGFFLRLGLTIAVLYVSLKYLNGSVYGLAAGLGLGVVALMIQGLRLLRAWTV